MTDQYMRVDNEFHWVEGAKRNVNGKLSWFPLYCYRANDLLHAKGILAHILKMAVEDRPMPDELDTFEDFRLRLAGTPTDAIDTVSEIRNPAGGYALSRQLREAAARLTCQKVNPRTGAVCVKKAGHSGKHSDH